MMNSKSRFVGSLILACVMVGSFAFAGGYADAFSMRPAPKAKRNASTLAAPLASFKGEAHASAPKSKGAPVVKAAPSVPRVMVCGAPKLLRTSTWQTVKVCEYVPAGSK
jgi:hypothetical protein